jgi:hypothetical protein
MKKRDNMLTGEGLPGVGESLVLYKSFNTLRCTTYPADPSLLAGLVVERV